MNETVEFFLRAVLIGAGATVVMDLWAVVLRQFGVPSLNLAFLGRWIGHLPRGHWRHLSIASATPVRGESSIGWCAHYAIGMTFSALLLWTYGLGVGSIADFAPRLVHGDRHGSCTIAHLAAGDRSRDRVEEDVKAGLQLHQEPGHSHGLRPRYVPRGARDGFARPLQ